MAVALKKSGSEEALNAFTRGESSLSADGALVFDRVGYKLPSSDKWLVKDVTGYVVSRHQQSSPAASHLHTRTGGPTVTDKQKEEV